VREREKERKKQRKKTFKHNVVFCILQENHRLNINRNGAEKVTLGMIFLALIEMFALLTEEIRTFQLQLR
jgi:hypothetical protein